MTMLTLSLGGKQDLYIIYVLERWSNFKERAFQWATSFEEVSTVRTYDGVRRVSGLRREPVVSVKNCTLIPTSHWKRWSRPCRDRLQPSRCEFCARNSQREGRSLPRQGRDHLFQWDVGIIVGFSTDTIGSLRNPETRRNPLYEYCTSCRQINLTFNEAHA